MTNMCEIFPRLLREVVVIWRRRKSRRGQIEGG